MGAEARIRPDLQSFIEGVERSQFGGFEYPSCGARFDLPPDTASVPQLGS